MGMLNLPHYRGSNQSRFVAAPVPYIRYHGKRLKIDKEGTHFYLYEGKKLKIDISTAFAIGVDSSDNEARRGMPDLGWIAELGPRAQWELYHSADNKIRFRFALPIRRAFATDFNSVDTIGTVIAPYFQLRYFQNGWESALSTGPVWADHDYHDYFYSVRPEYVTVSRSAYQARSGYSGARMNFTTSKRYEKVFFGFFTKYDYLEKANFIQSPLIQQKDNITIGVVLSWVFKGSRVQALYEN